MGMQQILMVVLGVIIVGVAVTVGIVMFGTNAYNSNRSAINTELHTFAGLLLQYWKMPPMMGGAGMSSTNVTTGAVAGSIGFTSRNGNGQYYHGSDNGEFRIKSVTGSVVVIGGLGKELKNELRPYVETTVNMENGSISSVVTDAADFPE